MPHTERQEKREDGESGVSDFSIVPCEKNWTVQTLKRGLEDRGMGIVQFSLNKLPVMLKQSINP